MFANSFSSHYIVKMLYRLLDEIKESKFNLLEIMHHYTSGMKAVFTQECNDGLLAIRQSIGGAGYTNWSGIPSLIEDYSPQITFEGDNTVMAQQSANFLLKLTKKSLKGKEIIKEKPLNYIQNL